MKRIFKVLEFKIIISSFKFNKIIFMLIKVIDHSKKKIIIYHLFMSTNAYNCTCHYIQNNLVRIMVKEIKEH